MLREMKFMTEILDKKGVKEGDRMIIKPFHMKKRTVALNRTNYDFFANGEGNGSVTKKILGSVHGEKFHFQLQLRKSQMFNKKVNQRYFLKSLCGLPFRLNGNWVMEAFVEVGDYCELGYHVIQFANKECTKDQFNLMQEALEENKKVILSNLPILLEGETGVGKTSLAKIMHESSERLGHFVHINISSLSKNLLESELFGHVKGAFTGANSDKTGALKLSHGGTLFIDEIDSLPLEIQTKLLIFLDEKKIRPVGGIFEEKVNTRIICASGANLMTMVEQGKMRRDFYYRISSGLCVKIPSLRDRPEMIHKFCQLYSIENRVSFSNRLLDFYKTLPWPGNIRQLKGHLDKKTLITNGFKLDFDPCDEQLLKSNSSLFAIDELSHTMTLEEIKLNYIRKVYFECHKNLSVASQRLGISRRVLKRIIEDQWAA